MIGQPATVCAEGRFSASSGQQPGQSGKVVGGPASNHLGRTCSTHDSALCSIHAPKDAPGAAPRPCARFCGGGGVQRPDKAPARGAPGALVRSPLQQPRGSGKATCRDRWKAGNSSIPGGGRSADKTVGAGEDGGPCSRSIYGLAWRADQHASASTMSCFRRVP